MEHIWTVIHRDLPATETIDLWVSHWSGLNRAEWKGPSALFPVLEWSSSAVLPHPFCLKRRPNARGL